MPISVVFDPPLPSDSPSTFNTKAFTLLGDLNDWSTQANALPGEVATNLSALLASPPAIGGTTPAAGSFTNVNASVAVSSVAGVFIGADQDIYAYESATNALTFRVGASGAYRYHSFLADGSVNFFNGRFLMDAAGAVTFGYGTFGYGVGAGGTVTQATSKATTVTLNKPCGQITMNNAALAAGATVIFQLSNSYITASSVVTVQANTNSSGVYEAWVYYCASGLCLIAVKNNAVSALGETVVINFAVISGATS